MLNTYLNQQLKEVTNQVVIFPIATIAPIVAPAATNKNTEQ